jgi:hypothetical protein
MVNRNGVHRVLLNPRLLKRTDGERMRCERRSSLRRFGKEIKKRGRGSEAETEIE